MKTLFLYYFIKKWFHTILHHFNNSHVCLCTCYSKLTICFLGCSVHPKRYEHVLFCFALFFVVRYQWILFKSDYPLALHDWLNTRETTLNDLGEMDQIHTRGNEYITTTKQNKTQQTVKTESRHDANFVVIGGTAGCGAINDGKVGIMKTSVFS